MAGEPTTVVLIRRFFRSDAAGTTLEDVLIERDGQLFGERERQDDVEEVVEEEVVD